MTVTIYGIKNCDTVKKARSWLEASGVEHRFVDYRAEGLDPKHLARWKTAVGWEKLLNRASTTFKQLSDADKAGLDEKKALALMQAHPTLIKRPVLDVDGAITVGFKPQIYEQAVSSR
ncbi:MAG: arsenate reductase [Pseudomonadota bacterium]|nr:arsenate reductase [Pseudomonadota bacterium]MDQ2704799.1 arsenate reductase [Pseudomonadota bacterium]